MQDLQLCDIAGIEQVWTRDGWDDRFGLDLAGNDHGYGHGPDDVGKVRAPADLLAGYYHAVHKVTLEYIASVTAEELSRVVDTHWTPPVTASARLVSIIDDCAQHLGQAAYVRGIAALTVRDSPTAERCCCGRRSLWRRCSCSGWGSARARPRWTTGSHRFRRTPAPVAAALHRPVVLTSLLVVRRRRRALSGVGGGWRR